MSSFARTVTGDFDFSGHGLRLVTDKIQCAAWDLQDRLALARGEWVFDTSQGVPYFTFLGIKNPPVQAIIAMLRQVILSVQPVVSVEDISVNLNRRTRHLSYTFQAKCDTGAVIVGGSAAGSFVILPPGGVS